MLDDREGFVVPKLMDVTVLVVVCIADSADEDGSEPLLVESKGELLVNKLP